MDDDNNPRPAQPKPRLLQMSVPRPVVPEVSLMFDSDDSFIWQPQKPRGHFLNKDNNKGTFSTRFHHSNIQPINEEIADEGISKHSVSKNSNEGENRYLSNQKNIDIRKPSWNSHTNIQNPGTRIYSEIHPNTDMLRNSEEALKSNVETLHNIGKVNLPFERTRVTSSYSSSLASSYVPAGRNDSSPFDESVPRVSDNEHVSVNTRIKHSYQITGDGNRPMNLGGRNSPHHKSNLPVLTASTQSVDQCKIPSSVSYNPQMYDSSLSENVQNQNTHHLQKKSVQFQDNNNLLHKVNDNFRNIQEKENIPSDLFSNELAMKNKYSRTKNENHGYQFHNFSESPVNQKASVAPTQHGSPDPFFYQMIQNQNQQILNLSNALERLLGKEQKDNMDKPENIKRIKETGIQTEDNKKQCITVGVNTDIVWCDLLESIEQKYQHDRTRKTSCSGSTPRNLERDSKVNSEFAKDQNCEGKFSKDHKSLEANNNFKSKNREVHNEVSLTLREIVMTTIQDDPPSPEPSLHLEMQEYPETIYNNNHQGKWSDSPVLGESASMYERNSPPNSASRRQNGNLAADQFQTPPSRNSDRYNEDSRNHRQESRNRDIDEGHVSQKNLIQSDSNNNGGMTYYNNVMMNVQQILQSSRSEEESKDKGQQMQEQETDPQIAAVKQQLLHFGISFIDPATLTSKQNRGILDSLYLPRLQHMGLSVYQSEAVTTSVQPIDATAAKYLTDSQLAAIAAMSPAMSSRKMKQTERNHDVQMALPSLNYNIDTKTGNPNNFSIATRNFLGKYGLRDET